jgi:hypothetical protein
MILSPSIIAALVARSHGQVILTREELYDAERLMIGLSENDRGEWVITTFEQDREQAEQHQHARP